MGVATGGVLTGIGALMGGIGAIGNLIGGNNDQVYEPTINPYTDQTYNALQGYGNQAWGQMQQYQLPTYQGNMQALQGSMPGLMDMRNTIMGDYGQNVQNTANLQMQQNFRDVGNQFGNMGAVNSGAAMSAMARGAAMPYSQAMQNIAGMQSNLGQNLVNMGWGGIQNLNNLGMQQQQIYGNILGNAMGGMSNLGNPAAWPQDTVVGGGGNPFGNMMSGMGGIISGLGNIDWDNDPSSSPARGTSSPRSWGSSNYYNPSESDGPSY